MSPDPVTTEIFARIYGLYLLAAGIGVLVDRTLYARALAEFRDSPALGYLAGIAAFLVGAVTVALHDDWSGWAAAVISLIGWIALAEGVAFLAARPLMTALLRHLRLAPAVMAAVGAATAVLGAALLWAGFAG